MSDADVAEWLCERAAAGLPADADMGRIEKAVEAASLEARREAVERLVQRAAKRRTAECPGCGGRLRAQARRRGRRVLTRCGPVRFWRDYGRCPACGRYSYPADAALGLHGRAAASPVVQEICALEALAAPAGRKARDVRRLTGLDIDPFVMHREARRQGEAARTLRDSDAALDVLRGLEGFRDAARTLTTQQRAAFQREIGYFDKHKGRMDYKNAKKLGQPAGSGAIESTCSQYQRRFKLTGQFWSLEGDEAFLALETLHRNERWHLLFPHDND